MTVEFNEENSFNQVFKGNQAPVSGLTKWVIDQGIAKNEKGAKTIMVVVAIIFFGLAIYFATK